MLKPQYIQSNLINCYYVAIFFRVIVRWLNYLDNLNLLSHRLCRQVCLVYIGCKSLLLNFPVCLLSFLGDCFVFCSPCCHSLVI